MASDAASARSTPPSHGSAPVRRLTRTEMLAHTVAAVGFLIQAITGLGTASIYDEVAGWPLLIHMFGAGMLLLGMAAVAIIWADRCRLGADTGLNLGQKLVFWVALVLGLIIMLSMLVAMLPIFGTEVQHELLELHETGGWLFLCAMIVHTVVSLAARRAQR
jgi:cytochrome b subunit of formate dehydrogenase